MSIRPSNRRSAAKKKQRLGFLNQKLARIPQRRCQYEVLESRQVLTAYLFIDYGDNFPAGTLTTTQGAFRDVADDPVGANRILGTPLPEVGGFDAADQLNIVRQAFTATERAQILAIVQRAYEPLDVTVVDLSSNAQVTADGRTVEAATSMADVVNTLRAGDPNAKDAYIFVATFIADPGGPNQRIYTNGGGLSPSNTLGETSDLNAAANIHDDVAVVYSDGGFSFNTVNNIAHEAGHNFGLRHSITGDPATAFISLFHQLEIMSYQNTNSTSSSTFTRYPMIAGDVNTPIDGVDPTNYNLLSARNGNVTIYDQLRTDAGVGQNPNFDFITGTGAHDIITLTRNGAFIDVAVQAFANGDFTGPIQVPGEADSTFNYSIAAGLPIRLYAGGSNDRVVINGDLGVDLFIDGMLGTDQIVINALGADVTYTPDATSEPSVDVTTGFANVTSFGGFVVGGSSIAFNDFESTSGVSILGAGTVTYVTPGVGSDNLTVSLNAAGNPQVAGTVDDGNAVIPLVVTGTRLAIETGAANDTVTVDSSNGLVVFANGISFDGGAGFDGLNLRQTGGATRTNGRVNVGANPGDGQSIIDTQVVNFQNIEPITDNVLTTNYAISSAAGIASLLDASNAINYEAAEINPATTWGRVTVDNFEPIEFINKTNLVIDAGAGSDEINLNNPNTPTGLTNITVNGGAPTASDSLIVNGAINGADAFVYTPIDQDSGTVTNPGTPQLNFNTVEHLVINGQNDANPVPADTLTIDTINIFATEVLTPGAQFDSGSIEFREGDPAQAGFIMAAVPVRFQRLGLGSSLTLFDTAPGRFADLIYRGTDLDDTFSVDATGQILLNTQIPVNTPAIINLTLAGLSGDDTFNIVGNHNLPAIFVEGGDPSASDVLNLVGVGAGLITVDYELRTIAQAGGGGATSFSGIEYLNVDTNSAPVTLLGETTGPDRDETFTIRPQTGATSPVLFERAGDNTRVTVFDVGAAALTLDTRAGVDVVNYEGLSGADIIAVTYAATTTIANTGVSAVGIRGGGTLELNINGNNGNDTITLTGNSTLLSTGVAQTNVFGGAGNDTVNGSAVTTGSLTIYGNDGNDNLIGGDQGGANLGDTLFGGDGDDRLEGGTGQDFFFGGAGSDQLVWVAGDGSDLMEGGDGEDEMLFDALGGANRLELFGGGRFGATANPAPNIFLAGTLQNAARSIFALNSTAQDTAAVFINMGEVEHINIDAGAGADQVSINNQIATTFASASALQLGTDLAATAVRGVEISAGPADAAADAVEIHGLLVADTININGQAGNVDIAGFNYSIRLSDAVAADGDILIVHGNDGDDSISSPGSLLAYFANTNLRLNGGTGNDNILANGATFDGGAGDDFLTGGTNNDVMDGGAGDDTFVGGGGTDNVGGGVAMGVGSVGDTLLVAGTAGVDTMNLSLNATGQLLATLNGVTTTYGNFIGGTFATGGIEQILVQGQAGNDSLTVNSTNGAVPALITYDGGTNNDSLTLLGGTATANTYTVGPTADRGTSVLVIGGVTQTVGFLNIEPMVDLVAGPLTVVATNADNAINYGPGSVATNGLVSIDGFETIEFSNKTNLVIDAGAGSDQISLNNPNTPTGLIGITVNGGNPTAGSDVAIISGRAGAADAINFVVTTDDDAVVTGAGPVPITLATVESAVIDGQGGADTLTYTSPAGIDLLDYAMGTVDSEGRITGSQNNSPFSILMPMSFTNIFSLGTALTFADAGGARTDSLSIHGSELDETFTVTPATGALTVVRTASGAPQMLATATPGVNQLILQGNDGSDTFNIPGNHPFALAFGAAGPLVVEGGNPDGGSDVLNFTGGGAAITVSLSTTTITETGFSAVAYLGVEDVTINGAAAALTVNGTTADDRFDVQPTAAGTGSLQVFTTGAIVTTSPQFTYTNVNNGAFTLNGNTGFDDVHLLGTNGVDTITSAAATVTQAGGTVTFGTALERLHIESFAGNDSITLTTFASVPTLIEAGDGNDTVQGSTLVDIIYGGAGNDILVGGGGDDFLYGEDGNDIFGNLTLTADGTADDPGADQNFGGAGFDNFVWEPGDGADNNNGGGDAADIFRFFGDAAANTFTLRSGGTATHFNALIGALVIDNHGIEDVIVDGQGGGDTYIVEDLFATEVVSINLVTTAGAADSVTINGRNVADNISLASPTATRVALSGLRYNVNVDNAVAADGDILIVNGNDGNDTISSPASLLAFFTNANLRLNGGAGNDNILGNGATFDGGAGDDFLTGGTNNDIMTGNLAGGADDDTFVGGGGTDNVGGGGTLIGDTILVGGTSGADTINLALSATGSLIATVNGVTTTYNNFIGGPIAAAFIDQILVQAQNGNDGLTVNSANGAIPLLITYDGGANNDLLTLTGGTATSDTYAVGPEVHRGTSTIVIGGVTQQVSFVNIEPVIDLVAGPLLVLGTNSNDTITYTQGPNVGAPVANSGLVSVDGFETIEFGNKTVLSINALAGNDSVTIANTAVAAPTGLTQIIVTGSTGDDVIDASTSTVATPLRLYGGVGNDTLIGGLGNDLYFGEQGNDILVDSPGADAFDGGNNGAVPVGFAFPALPAGVAIPAATADPITATAGFDTIVIRGTGNNDVLAATQNAATAVAGAGYSLAIFNSAAGGVTADVIASLGAADVPNALASRPSVEEVRIEAGFGNDEIIVGHADAYVAASGTGAAPVLAAGAVPQQMVRFDVRGDAPNASDRLTIQDLGFGDLVLLRQSLDQRTGRVTVAPAVNTTTLGGFFGDVVYTGIEKVNITPINPLNGATGTNGLGQVVVFDTDPFEYNDNILNAEDIAHLELVTRNPNIDPGHNAALPVVTPAGNGDEDWYAFTADQNGTFTINTLFTAIPVAQPTIPGNRPGLPGNGLLTSALYNAIGAATVPLVVGSPLLGPTGALIGQQLQFAGVKGVTYYLRIVGLNATPNGLPAVGSVSTSLSVNTYDISLSQIDNLGPQVFDPDGANFPAQAIQIVDSPLYNLFDNKQVFNSQVAAAPAPTISAAGVVSFNVAANLPGLQIGQTVTFTSGVNAGLSDTITAINGNRLTFGSTTVGPAFVGASVFLAPAAGDAFFVGAPTPTPNVNGLTINFRDPISGTQVGVGPGAALGALDPATALNPGNYILRGDANGIIPIQNVRFAVPATGIIGGAVLAPVAGALNTTITLNAGAGLSVANGPIVGQTLQFTSGANAGLSGRIVGYNAVTGEVRFASPFLGGAAAVGDTFIISPSPIVISPTPVLTTASVTAASTNVVVNLGVGAVTGAGLSTVAGTYVGQALQIVSGALAGETRTITAYNGAGVFTVSGAVVANGFSAAPAVGTVFNIVGTPTSATSTVAAASLADSIVGGAGLSAVNGFYDGQALQFTSGPLSGQSRVITAYTVVPGVGPIFAFANGFTAAPAVGNAFVIVPAAPASLSNAVQAVIAAQGRFVGGLGGVAGAGLNPAPQAYLGQILQFTSGALSGQAQVISDYANGIFAFSNPFSANPAVGDTFNILPVNVAAITLDFASPLPDDRYTLTVSDELRDFVGNQLDGNSGAAQPTGSPVFPSGDGVNGGDFIARFNVDSRPELGTWAAGSMWADINGNQTFDPSNTDFTNRDFAYLLGFTSDELFAGNFADVSGTFADGFDKIAAYGRVGSQWRWMIDTDNDGVPNINQVDPAGINGYPMSGDFAPALPGDEVGLFTGTTWFLDIDGDFVLNDGALGVRQLAWTRLGAQVNGHGFTGDFDGDGAVDLGSWSNDLFSLSLSSLSGGLVDGVIDTQFSFGFPGVRERPVAADMNRDGIDDIGLWNPDRATQIDGQAGEWYWLVSGIVTNDTPAPGGLPPFPVTLGPTIPQRVVADPITAGRNIVAFTTTPFGNDLYMQYGDAFSLPIVGNFDPPAGQPSTHGLTNTRNALDVDNDGLITALDALSVINQLNIAVIPEVPTGGFLRAPFLDVDGDSSVTALDALVLINWLNDHPVDSAGESFTPASAGEATDFDEDLLIMLAIEQNERDRN